MRKNWINIFLVIVGILLSFPTRSQDEINTRFEFITMKDGLSMNPVTVTLQDKKGYLWFGTYDGLNKYDGYKFTIFKNKDDDSTSISDNFITAGCLDKEGNLWIGTLSGGLSKYNSTTGRFSRFNVNIKDSYSNSRIWTVFLDRNDILWIGTDEGLVLLDTKTNSFINLEEKYPALQKLSFSAVLSVCHDKSGLYWIGTSSGLIKFDPVNNKYKEYTYKENDPESLASDFVLTIKQDSEGALWIGTIDGLCRFNPITEKFTTYYFKQRSSNITELSKNTNVKNIYSIINNYGENTVRAILEDSAGVLMIATDPDLIRFNAKTGRYVKYKMNSENMKDFAFIRTLLKDNSGNIWVGTLTGGVTKLNLKARKFQLYRKDTENPYSLSESYIRALTEDKDGNLWIGTMRGGLNKFVVEENRFYHYLADKNLSDRTIGDNSIRSLLTDRDGLIWIGTNMGLEQYNPETKKFRRFNHAKNTSISENSIRCIFQDSRGNIWLGTEAGLNKFDYQTGHFSQYIKKGNDESTDLGSSTVWKILEDNEGHIWIGSDNGLTQLDTQTGKLKSYKKRKADTTSLSHNGVRTLFIDSKGILWVGTQNGLNKFDQKNERFRRYNESDGLPNHFIYGILEDNKGNLWISTNKGVTRFDPEKELFTNYDIYDGLQDYEFNTNTCFEKSNGEMFFGGPNGLNRFDPQRLPLSKYDAPIEITGIRVNDRTFESEHDISEMNEITLNYDQNILNFEFASLDYTNPSRNQYAYIMEGFNQDWIYCGNNRYITYTNLDPGEYTFRVKGTNSDNIWSSKVRSVKIIIRPPFWKTRWFYSIIILLTLGAAYSIYLWRVKNLENEKKLLEENVKIRTRDLEVEKQKVERVNEELEKLSIVARETQNAVLIADVHGKIEWGNESCMQMYESLHEKSHVLGLTISEISSHPDIENIVQESIRENKSMIYESINTTRDGRKFWTQSTLTPISDEDGNVKKIVIIDADITERKQAEEIIKQKNKDITDSILYAKRIQQAILPYKEEVYQAFPDSFIFYRPRDIVSGDFYWFTKPKHNGSINSNFLIAAADCTGHGVPGAFMSMIGSAILNEIVNEKGTTEPAKILASLNEGIIMSLKQGKVDNESRDGMDIALCAIEKNGIGYKSLQYAGAFRPLYLIRKGELHEIKGDKYPIGGKPMKEEYSFNNHSIPLEKGDTIYIFTDGFADQFGGEKQKKFMVKRFQELLLKIHHLPMDEQERVLADTLRDWQGGLEQVDDILVIGIKV